MTLLTLTPANLNLGGASPFNQTAALAASPLGTNTGILFPNSGREVVVVQTGSGGSTTVTSDIGTQVEGQTPPGVAAPTQALSTTLMYGPYQRDYDKQDGTYNVQIDFGTPANVTGVIVVRVPGAS